MIELRNEYKKAKEGLGYSPSLRDENIKKTTELKEEFSRKMLEQSSIVINKLSKMLSYVFSA